MKHSPLIKRKKSNKPVWSWHKEDEKHFFIINPAGFLAADACDAVHAAFIVDACNDHLARINKTSPERC